MESRIPIPIFSRTSPKSSNINFNVSEFQNIFDCNIYPFAYIADTLSLSVIPILWALFVENLGGGYSGNGY